VLPSGEKPSLPDYELLEQLGRGGAGVVYRARQRSLDRFVALKVISAGEFASPASVARFRREAEAAAKLDHPNIVPIYEIGEQEATPYLVMRLVEGTNLSEAIEELFPRNAAGRERRVAELISTVARAVDYAHSRGVLHRDLKPSNILIDAAGKPHLTDFGLAKFLTPDAPLTQTAELLGTPFYMSPEQAAGKPLGVASDIFSLGVILYELLTSQRPFNGERPVDVLRQVIEEDPIPPTVLNPSLDRDLATICLKALDKDPARRYRSARALAEDLERWQRREPIQARRAGPILRLQRWTVRNPALATLIVGLTAGMAISLTLLAAAREEKSRKSTALAILRTETVRQLQEIWNSPSPFFGIKSETLSALAGNEPGKLRAGERRLIVGMVADGNPVDGVLGVAPVLERMERSISTLAHEPTRLDLRMYKSQSRAIAGFLSGEFDIMPMNARDYVRAKSQAPSIQLLARLVPSHAIVPPETSVIFTRASTGIKQIEDLRGKSLLFGSANSMATFWAKTALMKAGIHAGDLATIRYLDEPEQRSSAQPSGNRRRNALGNPFSEMTPVEAVLDGTFDAAVATERRFTQVSAGKQLVLLQRLPGATLALAARVETPLFGPIREALIHIKDSAILQSFPGSPGGFAPCTDNEFEELRKQLKTESRFEGPGVAGEEEEIEP